MSQPSIEQLREALQQIHRFAMGVSDRPYMSLPARPERDADLLLSAALDELEALRAGAAPVIPAVVPTAAAVKAGADFWTVSRDEEHLSHESMEEAVEYHLDEVELGEVEWPLKVYGWSRREVSDKYLKQVGEWLAEKAQEWLDEEFGGDAEPAHQVLDTNGQESLARTTTETLIEARQAGEIVSWQCEVSETREMSEAEARGLFPEWFAEADRLPPRDGKRSEGAPA